MSPGAARKCACLSGGIIIYVIIFAGFQSLVYFYPKVLENLLTKEVYTKLMQLVSSHWYFLVYVPVFNLVTFLIVGRYLLSAALYPYQNSICREFLDKNNARIFGEEFAHYLSSMVYTIRLQSGMSP